MRSEDVAELVPCGPNVDAIVAAVGKFVDAGFTHVALVQVGDAQRELCEAYAGKLGAALREL